MASMSMGHIIMNSTIKYIITPLLIVSFCACSSHTEKITPNLRLTLGDVNGAVITSGAKHLVIYGDPENNMDDADVILFTHANRNTTWAGKELVKNGTRAIVPNAELAFFTQTDSLWDTFPEAQFYDYDLQTIRVPAESFKVNKSVKGGDTIHWNGIDIVVINSRGYSPGAVSYIMQVDHLKVAFVGDLIYGDGQIYDLYSLQDQIPELNVMGYHGYAARISDLIQSLNDLAELKPDILIPSHGPVIRTPEISIDKLIGKLQLLYENYLSTSAYTWHRSQNWQNNPDIASDMYSRVSPATKKLVCMSPAEIRSNPEWLIHFGNSKLIISEDHTGFLIDCGDQRVYTALNDLEKSMGINKIEGIFVTHYHNDHTDFIEEIRNRFKCPVYVTRELEDILKFPESYKLPALSSRPIKELTIVEDNSSFNWKEFKFTFRYFPGQTLYHNSMLAEHAGGEKVFFVGDSFSPTGMDDYCMQNRNFIKSDAGYLKCLDILEMLPKECWLANNHVEPIFRFKHEQLDYMRDKLKQRKQLLSELLPWDDPNYGIDASWARMTPYSQILHTGETSTFSVAIFNHSHQEREYTIEPGVGNGVCKPLMQSLKLAPNKEGSVEFTLDFPGGIPLHNRVITADIGFDGKVLHEWCESVFVVK